MSNLFYPPGQGYCLIIGNYIVTGKPQLPQEGIENDCQLVKDTFKSFNCRIHKEMYFINQNYRQTDELLKEVAQTTKWSEYQFLVVYLTSHGNEGYVFCSDGESYQIREMLQLFSNEKSLKGKPKIFIIDACQGTASDRGVQKEDTAEMKPIGRDCLVIYGAFMGTKAAIFDSGSRFTVSLCQQLNQTSKWTSLHLVSLLTVVVSRQVAEMGTFEGKQMPYYLSTLPKFMRLHKVKETTESVINEAATREFTEKVDTVWEENDDFQAIEESKQYDSPKDPHILAEKAIQLLLKNGDFSSNNISQNIGNIMQFSSNLLNDCLDYCASKIADETVFNICQLALDKKHEKLRKATEEYILTNFKRLELQKYIDSIKTDALQSVLLGEMYRIVEINNNNK